MFHVIMASIILDIYTKLSIEKEILLNASIKEKLQGNEIVKLACIIYNTQLLIEKKLLLKILT